MLKRSQLKKDDKEIATNMQSTVYQEGNLEDNTHIVSQLYKRLTRSQPLTAWSDEIFIDDPKAKGKFSNNAVLQAVFNR